MSLASFRRTLFRALIGLLALPVFAQTPDRPEPIEVAPPMRRVPEPPANATPADLEKEADTLRAEKQYLDAIDYYQAALVKAPQSASLSNKLGIAELMLQRYKQAGKNFSRAIKENRKFAEAYNNLGVIDYELKRYGPSIKQYRKALTLQSDTASFYANLGASYFARKDFERATQAYAKAVEIDPEVFDHSSHSGVAAQMASPEDRAHYDYVVAKLYAKMGDHDHSLEFLRKSMEEGYKDVSHVYTDPEFADLRKDARFAELMKSKPMAIPE